ncbi:DUF202 domain-containing protein [Corynebacterium nuruki]|uniref:DUF202 domain-containing protein n=1 Tax=Corynebacterium nuruki TaxID=1032851 RepID=UPI0039BFFE57
MTSGRRDPGLQPERTNLAWGRTTLRLLLTATALLSWVAGHGMSVVVAAGVLAVIGLGIQVTQRHRYRRHVRGIGDGAVRPAAGGVIVLATATLAVGVLCVVLVILGVL